MGRTDGRRLTDDRPRGMSTTEATWVPVGIAASRFNPLDRYVAIAHGHTGGAFRRQPEFEGKEPHHAETQVELTWRTPLTSWLDVVPTAQWIDNPGVVLRFETNFNHSFPKLAE